MTAIVAILLELVMAANPAHASTFTVTNTNDSGAGSLRQAITDANARTGADTIKFNIRGTDTGCDATSGVCTIKPSSAELPELVDPVTIDGYSQPGAVPNTLAVGNNGVLKIGLSGASIPGASGLKIKATKSTVKGLIIGDWENGVFLNTEATGNTVQGNFVGTDTLGTQGLGNNIGVVALGSNNIIGGTNAAVRNVISGNSGYGVNIVGTGNKVQGNYIGTKANGTEPLSNNIGVVIDAASNNTIGGTTATARNIISGNTSFGIRIAFPGATNNKVQGNFIGTNARGTGPLANGHDGVSIQTGAVNNTIGGTTATARNTISGNGDNGLEILFTGGGDATTGNRILSNSIYDNGTLGIDLVFAPNDPPGVTSNDDGDLDTGPNNLQNFPELTKAAKSGFRTLIEGTLNSTANTTFIVQFFSSPAPDPSGNGEGQKVLGQKSVTTDGSGIASFAATTPVVPAGQVVAATATNQTTGDTSEFSRAVDAS